MKKISLPFEKLFIFSPVFIVICSIFNFSDTKSVVSRLSVVVIVYCIFRYRESLIFNLNKNKMILFIFSGFILFFYLSIMHLWRSDNFGFPRTLITCLLYLIVVPWDKFSKKWVFNTIIIASYICGFNAIYEHFLLGIERVGVAVNSIPYAFYCSFLSLSSLYFVSIYQGKWNKFLIFFGSIFSLGALILTESRGVWLAYPIVMFYVFTTFPSKIFKWKLVLLMIPMFFTLIFVFNAELEPRVNGTLVDIKKVLDGDNETSLGARLDLWSCGLSLWLDSPLIGVGDEHIEAATALISNPFASAEPHIHSQYLDSLARYGLIGLVLLIFWVVSGAVGVNNIDSHRVIIVCVGLIAMSGLSDVPLHHTHTVYLFGFLVGSLKLIDD